jgi:hypothetical protein
LARPPTFLPGLPVIRVILAESHPMGCLAALVPLAPNPTFLGYLTLAR